MLNVSPTLARFVRLTAGYSLVTLLGPVFTVLLTPLYTRVLSPADYGIVEAAVTLGALVNTFVIFSLDQALGTYFFAVEGAEAARYQGRLLTTTLLVVVGLGGAAAVLLALAARPLAQLLLDDSGLAPLLYLVGTNAISMPLYIVVSAALRLKTQVKRANAVALTFLLTTAGASVLLIVVLRFGPLGVLLANLSANTLAALLGVGLLWPALARGFAPDLARTVMRTGATLLPGALAYFVLASLDRLLLTQYVSTADLGLYSIANRLATMVYVLLSAAWQAWWPMALEMAARPEAPRQFARMFEYLAAGAMLAALGVGAFAPEILAVFTRDVYVPAAPYALALAVYYGPLGFLAQAFFIGVYARKRTHWVSVGYGAAAVVNVALNLLLNPYLGVWGAVWATVAAGAVLMGVAFVTGQRALHVPYRLGRAAALGALYAGLVAALLAMPAAQSLAAKAVALVVFAGVAALLVVRPGSEAAAP